MRREIRDLKKQEWNIVVKALNVMKLVPTEAGKKMYGEPYISYDELIVIHMQVSSFCVFNKCPSEFK